jgi:hypothetical protein
MLLTGDVATVRFSFAFFRVNERRDLSSIITRISATQIFLIIFSRSMDVYSWGEQSGLERSPARIA